MVLPPKQTWKLWLKPSRKQVNSRQALFFRWLPATCGAIALSACQNLQSLLPQSHLDLAGVTLQVQPIGQGQYALSGTTDLPDKSQLRVAALRRLQPDTVGISSEITGNTSPSATTPDTPEQPSNSPADTNSNFKLAIAPNPKPVPRGRALIPQPTYALLAYDNAEVVGGKWQTQLNLWQVAETGQFRENWQLTQAALKLQVQPEPEVMFLATIAPGNKFEQLERLEQELRKQGKRLNSSLINSTSDGTRYLRVNQILRVDLPQGTTTAPKLTAEQRNGGWGDRWILVEEVPNPEALEFPTHRRTNAPPTPQEFFK